MQCNHCEKETDERVSGYCVHCGNPLGMGVYAPPDGFAFDPGSGQYYRSENTVNPLTGTPVTNVLWFDPYSGQYQAVSFDQGVSKQDMPVEPPITFTVPTSTPPVQESEMPIDKKLSAPKKKRGKAVAIIVSLVIVVGLGGVGFGAWQYGLLDNFLNKSEKKQQSESPPVSEKPKPKVVVEKPPQVPTLPEDNKGKFLINGEDVITFEKGQHFTSLNDAIENTKDGGYIQLSGDVKVELAEDVTIERGIQFDVINDAELTIKGTLSVMEGSILNLNNGKVILSPSGDIGLVVDNGTVEIVNESFLETATTNVLIKIQGTWKESGIVQTYDGTHRISNNKLIEGEDVSYGNNTGIQPYYGFFDEKGTSSVRLAIQSGESFMIYEEYGGSGTQIMGLYRLENENELVLTPHDGIFNPLTTESEMRFTVQQDGSLCLLFPNYLGEMQAGVSVLSVGVPMPGIEQGYAFNGLQYGFPFVGTYEVPGEGHDISPITVYLNDDWRFFLLVDRGDGIQEQMSGKMEWDPRELCIRLIPDGFIDKMFNNREVVLRGQMTSDRQEMLLTIESGMEFVAPYVGSLEYVLFNVD